MPSPAPAQAQPAATQGETLASELTKENKVKWLTLVQLRCRSKTAKGEQFLLLGMKKRGFGEGKWNGYGGKMDIAAGDKTLKDCALRETHEESMGHLTSTWQYMSGVELTE